MLRGVPLSLSQLVNTFGVELHELNGTSLSGEIPIPAAVVNRFLSRTLAARQGPVGGAHVEPHDGQRLDVTLSLRGQRLLPVLKIAARIEQQPRFPEPAILGLRWSVPGLGRLALLAAPALSYFKAMPPGIELDGDRLAVNVTELLRSHGLDELVRYMSSLEIVTREGGFVVRFSARIGGEPQR
jgi:hypothetical protein